VLEDVKHLLNACSVCEYSLRRHPTSCSVGTEAQKSDTGAERKFCCGTQESKSAAVVKRQFRTKLGTNLSSRTLFMRGTSGSQWPVISVRAKVQERRL
jgi:hypothetical protein